MVKAHQLSMIIAGLLVELFSLRWSHSIAFPVFIVLGWALIGIGILLYLYSLVSPESVDDQCSDVKVE
jgi:hypothetical protein